ncbi:hypothetical protein HOLleu_28850 [Holothuria leucospilota]|uniref:Uncharacterized protein n=1 Tax=Holothuria leucospilota TaxID=206669 RepID=A0A9Q1GYT9_HOLLE|nr:hypothetical protein HOLleu_28850 [Holothuria leucospilota]
MVSWEVESVHICSWVESSVHVQEFPCLAVEVLHLCLCPLNYSCSVADNWHGICIDSLDLVLST